MKYFIKGGFNIKALILFEVKGTKLLQECSLINAS